MFILWELLGSHSLYVLDISKRKQVRELYSKRFGHTEWVTCVAHLKDGRVVSGGMDSKLCLWDSNGYGSAPLVRCNDLKSHSHSISCIKLIDDVVFVSGSYDKTLRIWAGKTERACLVGHKAPVLDGTSVRSTRLV